MSQLRIHLASAVAVALIILAVVAAALALVVSDGAVDTTRAADRDARFEGYEAGIARIVAARRATDPGESRVAAAIAGK